MVDNNEVGENEDSKATYVEKLEYIKENLSKEIEEGNQKKFQILSI